MHGAALWHQIAELARVGEEGHRRLGIEEHEVPDSVEAHGGKLGQVAEPLDRRSSRSSGQTCRKGLAQELGPGGGGQVGGCLQQPSRTDPASDEQGRALAGPERCRSRFDHRRIGARPGSGPVADPVDDRCHGPAVGPRDVCRQDEGGHRPRGSIGGGQSILGVMTEVGCGLGRADERRDVASDRCDVGLELGVILAVRDGVITDDVDDRTVGTTGVMQVGEPVSQTWAEVEQGCGWTSGDTGVAVGRSGGHTLEEGEHASHRRHIVEGGDEVHLRGARVHEAGIDPVVDEGADE